MNAITQIDPASPAFLSAELHRSAVLVPSDKPVPRFWTTREIKTLHETYPKGGVMLAAANLPGRTIGAIFQHARNEGLRSPRMLSPRKARWASTPHIDDAIRRAYQGTPYRGMRRDLAVSLMRPEAWITNRAQRLGVVLPRFKEPAWTAREIAIICERATNHPGTIRLALRREGFSRTQTAIVVKLKRLHISRVDDDDENLSANGLAEVMGVNAKTVTSWIDRGLLKASAIKSSRSKTAPTTEYRIQPSDVRRFLINNVAVYDVRKVDKFWFVDLIADPAKSFRKGSTPSPDMRDLGDGGGR